MKCSHCGAVILSDGAARTLEYMRCHAPSRGGFMYEGARPAYEAGTYIEPEFDELLSVGAIAPHPDPSKGYVVK